MPLVMSGEKFCSEVVRPVAIVLLVLAISHVQMTWSGDVSKRQTLVCIRFLAGINDRSRLS